MIKRTMLMLCVAGALAASCGRDGDDNRATGNEAAAKAEERGTIGEAIAGSTDHSEFARSLQSAGLAETLQGAGPYTVFAPTNTAFQAVPEDVRTRLNAADQRDRLVTLLSYHIVPGTVTAEDLRRAIDQAPGNRAELANVTGRNLVVTREGDAIIVADGAGGRARVTGADQVGSNGVVHSVDAVLMPSE